MAPDFKTIKLGGVIELEREMADAKQKVSDLEREIKVISTTMATSSSAAHLNLILPPDADVGEALRNIDKKVEGRDIP